MNLQTVTGSLPITAVDLADAHCHVWIDSPPQADTRIELNDEDRIAEGLLAFREAGGTLAVDCQPGECGRDANRLAQISRRTGVAITATTGFHQRKYYPPDHWLWTAPAETAADVFVEELTLGMRETRGSIPATTIKVGYDGAIEGQTRVLMEAAAEAGRVTGAVILFHTEQGRNVEALPPFFADRGVPADQLYLCHVDKRPDIGLHAALAEAGVLLGYDTFARPKYDPDANVWPLLRAMAARGLTSQVAAGLDLAFPTMWPSFGGEPGLTFLAEVGDRMAHEGLTPDEVAGLTGRNVARFLVHRDRSRENEQQA